MSIYQVPIKEWFVNPDSPFHVDLPVVEIAIEHGAKCDSCGKPVTLDGYCSHGIAYGFPEMYCSAKCAGYVEEEGEENQDENS